MSYFAAARVVIAGEYAGPRVGLTVGRVMGKAHERNRIKRRLREAIRAEQDALRGLPVDVILHPRRTVESLPFDQLRAEVRQVFVRSSRSVKNGELASQQGGEAAGRAGEATGPGTAAAERGGEAAGQRSEEAAVRGGDARASRPGGTQERGKVGVRA